MEATANEKAAAGIFQIPAAAFYYNFFEHSMAYPPSIRSTGTAKAARPARISPTKTRGRNTMVKRIFTSPQDALSANFKSFQKIISIRIPINMVNNLFPPFQFRNILLNTPF